MSAFYVGSIACSSELKHYGVLGMKWGVRRYQNKDGSLTAAGRKRQKLKDSTIEKAKAHRDMAEENVQRYRAEGAKYKSVDKQRDYQRWALASENQREAAIRIIEKYEKKAIFELDKQDLKEMKRFVDSYFDDAEYADYFQNGRWHNYLLDKR